MEFRWNFAGKKDQFSIVNPVAKYEAQLTLASHSLSNKQFSAGLHGEFEHELHGEIFRPHAKLPIAQIPIGMEFARKKCTEQW